MLRARSAWAAGLRERAERAARLLEEAVVGLGAPPGSFHVRVKHDAVQVGIAVGVDGWVPREVFDRFHALVRMLGFRYVPRSREWWLFIPLDGSGEERLGRLERALAGSRETLPS